MSAGNINGNVTLTGGFISESLVGGRGNDTLKLDSTSTGLNIDLTLIANQGLASATGASRIASVERIDLTGGGNNPAAEALRWAR